MFNHYINGELLSTEPIGWQEFSLNISRDRDAKSLLIKYPITLTFTGDGWNILKDVFDSEQGYCLDVDYRVEKSCNTGFSTLFEGKIFISQVEFNLNKCQAQAQVTDNSFFARIFNNKSLQTSLDVVRSKNGEVISSIVSTDITVFTPPFGPNLPDDRKMYDVRDVFEFLVQWMSDGEIGFRSDFYDNLPDTEKVAICTGSELRQGLGNGTVPNVSFDDIFLDQANIYNLLMTIETEADGDVFLRIEDDEFFFGSANQIELAEIDDMVEGVFEDDLYSSIEFGSPGSDTTGSFPQVSFISWNDEEFIIGGQCNTDNPLILTLDAVTNNNVIEDILGGDVDFDDDVVLIQYTESNLTATNTDPLETNELFYNEQFLNSSISARYDLQGNIQQTIGDGNDGFRASSTGTISQNITTGSFQTVASPFPFDDDSTPPNTDPNGNYDTVTFRYTAPLSGIYAFQSQMSYRWNTLNAGTGTIRIKLQRFDSGSSLIGETIIRVDNVSTPNPAPNTPYETLSIVQSLNLIATDYVEILVEASVGGLGAVDGDLEFIPGCFFQTTATSNGGGEFEDKDGDEYRVISVDFDRALDAEQILEITRRPYLPVLVDHDGVTKKLTYVNEVNINAEKGTTTWQMRRNANA